MDISEKRNGVTDRREAPHNPERTVKPSTVTSGADYILPDYLGDIKRVLNYSAKVIPSGRFLGSEKLSFVGIVCYSVIYLDSENRLTEASFTSDYEYEEKIPDGFVDADSECRLAGLSVRLAGPRKISAKASLCPEITFTEARCPHMPEDTDGLELLSSEISESSLEIIRSAEREYAEEVARLEGVSAEDVEELFSGGYVKISSTECTDGGIQLSGTLELYAILLIEGNTTLRVEKSIPVTELVGGECDEGLKFISKGYITSLRVSMNNSSDADAEGKEGASFATSVTFDATVEYTVRSYKNSCSTVVKDAFACDLLCECEYRNYSYTQLTDVIRDEREICFTVDKSELDTGDIGDILDTFATAKLTSVTAEDGELVFEGEINTATLLQTVDEAGYASHKATHSFKERLRPAVKLSGSERITSEVTECTAATTLDSSRLYIKCTLLTHTLIKEDKSLKTVHTVSRKEEEIASDAAVTVYYPASGEGLWSIAKRYRVSPLALAEENMLDATCLASGEELSLEGCKKIIISKL